MISFAALGLGFAAGFSAVAGHLPPRHLDYTRREAFAFGAGIASGLALYVLAGLLVRELGW